MILILQRNEVTDFLDVNLQVKLGEINHIESSDACRVYLHRELICNFEALKLILQFSF